MVDLHVDGVAKRYGSATALSAVDVDVADGEFFTLVGPSGCGKTTTLRIVAGFEDPTEGTVRFGERSMAGVPPEQRDVGVVFQNYALFPTMTVAENVGYGLRFRDPPDGRTPEERVAHLLDLVDLPDAGDRDPGALSGGQQQRVALARALAPGPEVLLLDEPMSALDARLRESLRRTVRSIQQRLDITTVYVTHDQAEALAISDRVAVMHDGRVEQVGTPQAVYREPATRFVAEFVGENNVFASTVLRRDGRGRAVVAAAGSEVVLADVPADAERVTFCVRPERLRRDEGENTLDVTVETVEFLGASTRIYGESDGMGVVVREPEVPDADRLTVGFDPADAHVIETE